MKIAIASSGLGHVSRGIEAWAADLAAALHAAGVPVTLFSAAPLPSPAVIVPCLKRSDARTARLLRHMPRGMWRLGLGSPYDIEQTTFAWHLIGELRQREIDILHVQDPGVAVLVQRAGRLGIVKTRVILAHGTEEPLSFLKKITYLQHLAPWHMEQAKAAGVHKPTWTAIPNFIDTEIFSPGRPSSLRTELGIPQDAPVVLTVAAIRRTHKRIDYLLSEFAGILAGHPGAHLVIAGGEESDTGELMREGKERLGERVHFLVRFPRARMPELYRNADLFVLCSLKEMMPIALIEAAASALPCVVHEHPVMRWMIGEGGVALDLRGANGLRSALGTLLNDARRRRELGAAAREHCVKHFGRDAVVSAIVRYYHDVMRARPREGCGNDAEGPRERCGNDVEGPRERCGTGA